MKEITVAEVVNYAVGLGGLLALLLSWLRFKRDNKKQDLELLMKLNNELEQAYNLESTRRKELTDIHIQYDQCRRENNSLKEEIAKKDTTILEYNKLIKNINKQ